MSQSLPHLPVLRAGEPYASLERVTLPHLGTGEPVAEVSQANPGLVARDLARSAEARRALEAIPTADLIALCKKAGELFATAELPLGDGTQTPADFAHQLSATTGLPQAMVCRNMEKNRYVLAEMETIVAGLTRGLEPSILDRGWGEEAGRVVSFRRETDLLGAVLPSNSPGVHSLWLPAIPLKTGLALKPGRQEPWTPYRIVQAFLAAGAPPEAFGLYPTSHAGASEILMRCGRSLLFGDKKTVGSWAGDERVQLHGPGWSKVVFGPDQAPRWREHVGVLAASVADNGGRSCINASGVWTPSHGREIAEGLAEELAKIEGRGLEDPEAQLAAFPDRKAAHMLSDYIDGQLGGGAEDVTARYRSGGRVAEVDGCAFVLPTVVRCPADHPLAEAEFLFPFVSVVESPADELLDRMGPSLVVTGLTEDADFRRRLITSSNVERLNLGPIPTSHVVWDQPHEGNLFDHLYRQRSFQAASTAA